MDLLRFEKFRSGCIENFPKIVDAILGTGKRERHCAIGLITTDDFYGFYVTWAFGDKVDIREYFEWTVRDILLDTSFLYQPLVDIVDDCTDIDFCNPSEEKWNFAVSLLVVLQEIIKLLPDEIFQTNGFKRDDVLFFAAMDGGDYMSEMIDTSTKMFNLEKTLDAFGVIQ